MRENLQNTHLYNEPELLAALAKGSEPAFTVIFDTFRDRIYHTALHHTGSVTMSEEVVQDVFLQLWIKRTGAIDIKNLKAYLHGIAEHIIYRAWKRAARNTSEKVEPGWQETPDILLEHKDHERILKEAIHQLPNKQRQAYMLVREQGLSREEAARALNVSPETIKSNLDHALKNIRSFCLARLGISPAILLLLKLV